MQRTTELHRTVFQSTLLQEERHLMSRIDKHYLLFQSTLLQEERLAEGIETVQRGAISIHAPTRGATEFRSNNLQAETISIHAPTRGATVNGKSQTYYTTISIHAPTRGATFIKLFFDFGGLFQSTLLQEERLLVNFRKELA